MARRDYKHRATRRKKRQPAPIWIWLLLGYLAGAVSVGFLWLRFGGEGAGSGWIGEPPSSTVPAPEVKPATSERRSEVPLPDFEFYKLLPDQEVVVPEAELDRPAPTADRTEKPPAPSGRKYLLQVGSMRSASEAEALKARLALMGLRAQVSRAQIRGVTWYRVRLGPYATPAEMKKVRKRLAGAGYATLPIALK